MSTKKQVALGVVLVAVALALFMPSLSVAGSLEPSAAPASTMKTLDQIPPTWSQKLPAAQRFAPALDGGHGVLDKETGLVWEQSPSIVTMSWLDAMATCQNKSVGLRKGWRLPTVEELSSLVDQTMSNPSLPFGHPFINVQSYVYWSATTYASLTTAAWTVDFDNGVVDYVGKPNAYYVWCVRGGQGYNGQ